MGLWYPERPTRTPTAAHPASDPKRTAEKPHSLKGFSAGWDSVQQGARPSCLLDDRLGGLDDDGQEHEGLAAHGDHAVSARGIEHHEVAGLELDVYKRQR